MTRTNSNRKPTVGTIGKTSQHHQLMAQQDDFGFQPRPRLEWRNQDMD
jgi:hypothetical protein